MKILQGLQFYSEEKYSKYVLHHSIYLIVIFETLNNEQMFA
jgi:hypothetical protein